MASDKEAVTEEEGDLEEADLEEEVTLEGEATLEEIDLEDSAEASIEVEVKTKFTVQAFQL